MSKFKHLKLFGPKLPYTLFLACSGGVDSMFALDFLRRGRRKVTPVFFHHGTETSEHALKFLQTEVARKYNTNILVGNIQNERPASKSMEEHWRDERYKFLHSLDGQVVMAHHLDDNVETWLFSAMHGNPKTIPYQNRNVVRPFSLGRKQFMTNWCDKHEVPWIEDKSNQDTRYMRNLIRQNIMPEVLKVNPGIHKVVARKVIQAGY